MTTTAAENGRRLSPGPRPVRSNAVADVPTGSVFLERWNDLPRTDRVYVRRIVRTGQRFKADEQDLAQMGVGYARYQLSKPWQRLFWVWFLPALVLSFSAGLRVHELVAGAVLGAALLAWSARRNLKRAQAVNASLLR